MEKLPIDTLKTIDTLVQNMDKECNLTDRQIAIREIARALISVTHDEYYNNTDSYDESYGIIISACQCFCGI